MCLRNAALLIIALGLPCAVAADNVGALMKPGQWEITLTVHLGGRAGLPHKVSECFSQEDIQNMRGAPGPGRLDRPCDIRDYKIRGDTATWKMVCSGLPSMSGRGVIIYRPASYSGKTLLTIDDGGPPQTVTTTYSGKYRGVCAH
jgi:hypothetical protein